MNYVGVSDAARELGVPPKVISDLFYQRELRDDLCPIIGGRRPIPRSYLPTLRKLLVKRGLVTCVKGMPMASNYETASTERKGGHA